MAGSSLKHPPGPPARRGARTPAPCHSSASTSPGRVDHHGGGLRRHYGVGAHDLPQPGRWMRLFAGPAEPTAFDMIRDIGRHYTSRSSTTRSSADNSEASSTGTEGRRSPRRISRPATARRDVPPRFSTPSNADDEEKNAAEFTRARLRAVIRLVRRDRRPVSRWFEGQRRKGPAHTDGRSANSSWRSSATGYVRHHPREREHRLHGTLRSTALGRGSSPRISCSRFGAPTRVAVVTALDLETILARTRLEAGRTPSRLLVVVLAC